MEPICIVDDDEAVRESLSVFLEACGYAAASFASALEFLGGGDPAGYSCLLLDMHMPGMSGIELLEVLRARGIRTPAILITAAADTMLRAQAEKLGGLRCLDKPVEGETLLFAIEEACAG